MKLDIFFCLYIKMEKPVRYYKEISEEFNFNKRKREKNIQVIEKITLVNLKKK
jgi:hypothetical protein